MMSQKTNGRQFPAERTMSAMTLRLGNAGVFAEEEKEAREALAEGQGKRQGNAS